MHTASSTLTKTGIFSPFHEAGLPALLGGRVPEGALGSLTAQANAKRELRGLHRAPKVPCFLPLHAL